MSEKPLTRAQLKAQREQEEQELIERDRKRVKAERAYRKQLKKEGRLTTSRTEERTKSREAGKFLNRAIFITASLLVIVLIITFFF